MVPILNPTATDFIAGAATFALTYLLLILLYTLSLYPVTSLFKQPSHRELLRNPNIVFLGALIAVLLLILILSFYLH